MVHAAIDFSVLDLWTFSQSVQKTLALTASRHPHGTQYVCAARHRANILKNNTGFTPELHQVLLPGRIKPRVPPFDDELNHGLVV